ncbi:MAG: phosphate acyltransferase PlsX [Eubacteriales bacterium]|nr:phosphate acyltransferase PlsX [Lachnospiraceae bacterium]MDO5127235.1 phosphate acyltransferase PlsX [Eubacteriales bacterium]
MDKITIAVDTMGGDNGCEYIMQGISEALGKFDDINVLVTGNKEELSLLITKYNIDNSRINIIHADEVITCHDAPVDAIRKKKNSSLVLALNEVKEGRAQACISSGNSGAILAGGQFIVGRAKGVKRTPLAPLIPTKTSSSLLIDCGANVDAKPENLVQFAKMGSIYMENIEGVKNPRVGIINIGTEDEKGNALVKATIPLLHECKDINFVGSIESREIPNDVADVLVCEAFVGNVLLKFYEGVGKMFLGEVKGTLKKSIKTKLGAALIYKDLKKCFKRFMADDKGGAPLLGLKGLVVKIHGNSKNREVSSALEQCRTFIIHDVNKKIIQAFENGEA